MSLIRSQSAKSPRKGDCYIVVGDANKRNIRLNGYFLKERAKIVYHVCRAR